MSLFHGKSNGKDWLKLLSDFTGLFFPEHCLGCSSALVKGEEILCTRCILELPRTNYHLMEVNPVIEKFLGRITVKHAWAFLKFRKTGVVQHLIHQLKYNNQPEIGIRLGRLLGREIVTMGLSNSFDVIIPMPLHGSRQRKRGYNQSSKFAAGLAETINAPYSDSVIVRKKNTTTQTRKNRTERWDNVKDAFEIIDPSAIKEKRILLVDDIITTGASLEACGKLLLDNACAELSIACIAEAQ